MGKTLNGEALSYDDLLTSKEMAHLLRVSVSTLERWRLAGTGPIYIKLGLGKRAKVLYRRSDAASYLNANRRSSTSSGEL